MPEKITFLHQAIQAAFGWLDYNLYNFDFGKTVVTIPDEEYSPDELYGDIVTALDSKKTVISELFTDNDRCVYEYDFGDSWNHEIVIEKRLKEILNQPILSGSGFGENE